MKNFLTYVRVSEFLWAFGFSLFVNHLPLRVILLLLLASCIGSKWNPTEDPSSPKDGESANIFKLQV